jgi:hypothetical protein
MFPAGAPGVALLVLRNCIALALYGMTFPPGWQHVMFLILLAMLCIGLLTPAACVLAAATVLLDQHFPDMHTQLSYSLRCHWPSSARDHSQLTQDYLDGVSSSPLQPATSRKTNRANSSKEPAERCAKESPNRRCRPMRSPQQASSHHPPMEASMTTLNPDRPSEDELAQWQLRVA